jgi:predicted nucleotidyltransferase
MISDIDKKTIQQIATKYHVKLVVLFGSSLSPDRESRDIDLGVEGVDERDFFSFYGDLIFALSKPVDVIDLSVRSRFVDLIKREGIPLYA